MAARRAFDVVVIGSGPGGYRAAVLAAFRGLRVAIVEGGEWGGACLNRGCVPKKAWYATARLAAANARYAARGLSGRLDADLQQAWRHQREVVATVRAGYVDYLARLGVATVSGHARLGPQGGVEVAGQSPLVGGAVILATGSSPFVPHVLPRHAGRILTTDDLFDAPPPPGRRVAVVGSGVVGVEMAFILAMLGCEVTWLVQSAPLQRLGFSAPALGALAEALGEHGLVARRSGRPRGCRVNADGVALDLPDGTEARVDWVLLAAGRRPNSGGLDCAAAGVALDDAGFVRVDDATATSAANVFAIGDCANPRMTSNHALAEATVAVANVVAPGSARRDPLAVPEVVCSAVELGRLGLSEDDAEHAGREAATGFAALAANPAALALGEPRGFVRLVADHDSGALLGAEAVGVQAGEWIHAIGAVYGEPDALARLARLRYNHPALAEEILNATESLAARWDLGAAVFGARGRPRPGAE